jgi:hypothetical protein
MRRALQLLAVAGLFATMAACDDAMAPHDGLALAYDFDAGTHGWVAAFTDYQDGQDEIYEFESGHRALPLPLDTARRAFMLSSMNRSDDMFQYIRRQVTGLAPDTDYDIRFRVQLATNAGHGCVGAGGPPGEGVVLKTGAAAAEPVPVRQGDDWRLSVDKGEQMEEGSAVLIIGDMANSSDSCIDDPYELKDFDSAPRRLRARTDSAGRLWLFVGTESGFESRTRIYITTIRADLERAG